MYQPKTGQRCSCKLGVYRDNCPNCEGTGWVINFTAIRAANQPFRQAEDSAAKDKDSYTAQDYGL